MGAERPHSPLDISRNEIRLITLAPSRSFKSIVTCQLVHHSLHPDTYARFDALSYAWGDASSRRLILLNGKSFSVTANLQVALRHLRYADEQRVLWIDALCINQDDIPERNQQVAKMHEIYQSAAKVVVWLGPASTNSSVAFEFLTEAALNAPEIDEWLPRNLRTQGRSRSWNAYCDIANRSYWRRVWIIQEIFYARNVIVRCGFRCISWPDFIFLFRCMSTRLDLIDAAEGVMDVWSMKPEIAFNNSNALDKLNGIISSQEIIEKSQGPAIVDHYRHIEDNANPPLESILSLYRNSVSTDPRDKVFAIVGMTGQYQGQRALTIDYSLSLKDTYIEAVRCMIERSIYLQRSPLNFILESLPHLSDATLPSWVPDWRAQTNFDMNADTGPLSIIYRASQNSPQDSMIEIEEDALIVPGLEIATVDSLGAVPTPYSRATNASEMDAAIAVNNAIVATIYANTQLAMSRSKQMPHRQKALDLRRMEFSRTLLCDHGPLHEASPRPLSTEMIRGFWEVISSLNRDKIWLKLFIGKKGTPIGQLLSVLRWNMQRYRFCVSSTGSFLMAPRSVRHGDIICVLFGCDMPVVLRQQSENHYVFVGDCYMDGVMDGEAIKHLANGKYTTKQFRIY